jgi:hypothetical protein
MRYAVSYQGLVEPEDPYRDFKPTKEQLAARAKYLEPLIRAKHPAPQEVIAWEVGGPLWAQFGKAVVSGDRCEAGQIAARMYEQGVRIESETLADNELNRRHLDSYDDTLKAIRAGDVWTWLRERDA